MNKSLDNLSSNYGDNVISHVRDMIGLLKRRGEKTEYAIIDVADRLGTSPRRVKSIYYKEEVTKTIIQEEARRVELGLVAYLDEEIERATGEIERLRQKRDGIKARLKCSKHSSGYTSNGLLSRSAA